MVSDIRLMSFPVIGNCTFFTDGEKLREVRTEETGIFPRVKVLCMSDGFFPFLSENAYIFQSPSF